MDGRGPLMDICPGMDNFEEPDDSEEDIAELEAMLYSQIHYSESHDESTNQDASISVKEIDNILESGGGYADSGCGTSRPTSAVSQYPSLGAISDDIESESDLEDSRYSSATSKVDGALVSNPFFQSSDSDSESDDGIIVLPKREKTPPELICLDSTSSSPVPALSSTIVISDNSCDEDHVKSRKRSLDNSMLEMSEEKRRIENKNSRKNISKSLKKSRKIEHYKADFGSDFEDNFVSDDSELEILSDLDESGLTLNLLGQYKEAKKKKVSEIFEREFEKTKNAPTIELPASWTKEMDAFYNDVDEKYLDIELEDIFAEMPPNSHWPIDRSDVYSGGSQRPRYFQGKKCNNCNQFGHLLRSCPEPEKIPRCCMCGVAGHGETRCPSRACLRCGQPGFGFLESCMHCRRLNDTECAECGYYGHVARDCPDLWRRFHMTTTGTRVTVPRTGTAEKPVKECWCCNCGRRGHIKDNCRSYSYSKYPPSTLRVVSYKQPKLSEFPEDIPSQSKKARREEKLLKRKHEKKLLKKNQTCPNSPAVHETPGFLSEPASPGAEVREHAFPTTLLVEKAVKKLGKLNKKEGKSKKKKLIMEELERGKSKKDVLAEILDSSQLDRLDKKELKKARGMKRLINACNKHKNFKEERMKEWKESRGFGKKESKDFPRNGENKSSRAAMIPTELRAACKFLKKEAQKFDASNISLMGKKLKKDLKQEIFGLKNLHAAPLLKKVERKRLADLVLELRNST